MEQFCTHIKKGIILVVLLILCLPVMSQKPKPKKFGLADYKKFHVGYSFGLGIAGFAINPKDTYVASLTQDPLIDINLIADFRIGKFLNIRFLPGYRAASRTVGVTGPAPQNSSGLSTSWSIESTYLELPILLKYSSSRVNNIAPYLIAGFSPHFDFTGKSSFVDPNSTIPGERVATRVLKPFDFLIELGTGVDFYLATTKVAAELKFSVGMLDIFYAPTNIRPADMGKFSLYSNGIDQIFSRMVILSFHVEQSK